MGCKNGGGFQDEEDERRSSSLVNEALLLTTMCIIGFPVDVHIKDGSVYSGIFHTACVDDHYAIVLKRARMSKKGGCDSNIANGVVIETLIIQSEDLVQVVAKRVLLPADGYAGHETGDDTGAVERTSPSNRTSQTEANSTMFTQSNVDQLCISRTRCSSGTENGFADGFSPQHSSYSCNALEVSRNANEIGLKKKEEALNDQDDRRQIGVDRSQGEHHSIRQKTDNRKEQNTYEVYGSCPSLNTGDARIIALENIHAKTSKVAANGEACDASASSNVKKQETSTLAEALSFVENAPSGGSPTISSESCVSSSSAPTEIVSSKSSSSNQTAKEFKLNPRAKIFSPTFSNQRSATPPAVPASANLAYLPENYPSVPVASTQPEVEISPYAPRSSLPIKFVPYGTLLSGNGGGDVQHPPPIVGHMTNRTQPVRYGGQFHPLQTAPSYVHPSSQNVVVGRLGQLVYVHPVSQDMVQSTMGFSQMSTCSLLSPHQVHVPKHQGTATAQPLQLCATPPFIAAGGQPPFVMPSHIPISQPSYPVIRPISVPGSNGFLGSKFS